MRWLVPILLAGPALADCPTADDLATGIRVTETTGDYSTYRDAGDGVVEVTISFEGEDTALNQLARGVYVLRLASTEDDVLILSSVIASDYGMAPADLPLPAPNTENSFEVRSTSFDWSGTETQTHRWGADKTVTIGDCTWRAIPGTLDYETELETWSETVLFLPDLGLGLLTSITDANETQTFTFTSIEAVP